MIFKNTFKECFKGKINTTVKLENKIIDASFTNITYINELVYTFQIGAYKNTIAFKQLSNSPPMHHKSLDNIITSYLFSDFRTL